MKQIICRVPLIAAFFVIALSIETASGQDIEGGRDHPLLTRMPGFNISEYQVNEFDAFEFCVGDEERKAVEGKKTEVYYEIADGHRVPGELQIVRNYINALTGIGAEVLFQRPSFATIKLVKEGMEIWVAVEAYNGGDNYELKVIEKQAMRQDVVADAASMGQSIRNTGKVSLYGIFFDSGKSDIKPESEAALKEIAKLLDQNPELRLYVVGHTDNDGRFDFNQKLSEQRALAVVQVLTKTHGISGG